MKLHVDPWDDYACQGCSESVEPAELSTVWSVLHSHTADSSGKPYVHESGPFFWHPYCWEKRRPDPDKQWHKRVQPPTVIHRERA